MNCEPATFYRERVPAQWNRTLDAQRSAAAGDADAQTLLEAMQAVNATIDVIVGEAEDEVGDAAGRFHLNIAAGRMSAGEAADKDPFITLVHDGATFETLERESGDSILGFLGALAGQPEDMKLTPTRLQNLNGLNGAARLELTGGAPLTLTAHFKGSDPGGEPTCTLRIAAEAYAALKSGELQPQDAFMTGQVEIQGDMQMAMQLALAALAPE